MELESLKLENKRRIAKNIAPYKTIAEYKKNNEEKVEQRRINSNVTTIDLSDDAILIEAGFILKDFIDLINDNGNHKVANFSH